MNANLKKLFKGALLAVSVFALAACSGDDDEPAKKTAKPVTFDVLPGTEITYGSTINAVTETEDASIVWSFDSALSKSTYEQMLTDKTAWETGRSYGALELKKETVSTYENEGNVTIYAFAYVEETKAFSAVTNVTVKMVEGPSSPKIELVSGGEGTAAGEVKNIYSGAVLSVTSEYTDKAGNKVSGVKVYVSEKEILTPVNYAKGTPVTDGKYTVTSSVGSLQISAIAVYSKENVNLFSSASSATFNVVPMLKPLASSVAEGTEGAGNYELDGGIQAFVEAVNGSTAEVKDLNMTLKGYVTMIFDVKDGNQWLAVQDKDAGVELYFGNKLNLDMSSFYLGQYVEFPATCGQVYNSVLEVKNTKPEDVKFDKSKDTSVLYYNVLTGKKDFSGLESFKLSAIKCDPDSDDYSNTKDENTKAYKNPLAVVYTDEKLAEGETAKAFFGYVALFDGGKTCELSVVFSKAADVMTDAQSALVNTVELPYTNQTSVTETGTELLKDDDVALYSITKDVTFTYAIKDDGDAEFGAPVAYDSAAPITFSKASEALQIKVTASKEGYNSCERIFTFKVQDIVGDVLKFSKLGLTNAAEIPDQTLTGASVTFAKNSNSNAPKYYNDSVSGRFYGSNSMTISTAVKTLKKVTFKWVSGYAAGDTEWTPSSGTYALDNVTGVWTPSDSETFDVTFTCAATKRMLYFIIEYNDTEYLEPVTFSAPAGDVDEGTVVTLSSASENVDIYYSTETALTNSNYSTSGIKGTSVTVNGAVTVYAIAVSGDKYSKGTSASYKIKSKVPAALIEFSSLAENDEIVIYNKTKKVAMGNTAVAKGYEQVSAEPDENDSFIVANGMLRLTAVKVSDGIWAFKNGDKYLISEASNKLALAAAGDDATAYQWKLTAVEGDSTLFYMETVKEVNENDGKTSPVYFEWNNNIFTTYYKNGTTDVYKFQFYKVGLSESPVIPVVAAPAFSAPAGDVVADTDVTISTTTTGAEIWYSFGTALTAENYASTGTKGTTCKISAEGTLYAISVLTRGTKTYTSEVASAAYTIASASDLTEETLASASILETYADGKIGGIELEKSTFKLLCDKGTNTNLPIINTTAKDFRIYKDNTVTVTALNGKKITGITIKSTGGKNDGTLSADAGNVSYDSESKILTWTGSADTVVFTCGKLEGSTNTSAPQFWFNEITVSYADAQGGATPKVLKLSKVNNKTDRFQFIIEGFSVAADDAISIIIKSPAGTTSPLLRSKDGSSSGKFTTSSNAITAGDWTGWDNLTATASIATEGLMVTLNGTFELVETSAYIASITVGGTEVSLSSITSPDGSNNVTVELVDAPSN